MLVEIAEAGLLPAAEGVIGDRNRDRHVDADHADVHLGCKVARGVAVAGEDGDAVAVVVVGRQRQRFLVVVRAHDYKEALALPSDHDYGNGVAIFTRDGDAARDFAAKVNVGMVGINVPIPVPIAYYTFGGWKKSGFGDLNQHGPDSIRFYTKTKTVTSRWPSGVKEGAEFSIPLMK